jgi:tetratricopeptide (TPR) repeat protein
MGAQGGPAANVVERNASSWGGAKIVAAVRVLSIDYRSIVENAVARLADNTAGARRKVYAEVRSVVKRHLQLMRLPEPIVELEKLALDLAVKKIERRWRAREVVERAVPDNPPRRRIKRDTVTQALGLGATALTALKSALRSRLLVLDVDVRPVLAAGLFIARALHPLMNPVAVVVALPIIATAVSFVLFFDDKVAYQSLVKGPAGQRPSSLDIGPSAPVSASFGAVAATQARAGTGNVATGRGPTRISPIHAEFAAAPGAPAAKPSAACGSGLSISERMACADDARGSGAKFVQSESDTPAWLASFARLSDAASGRAPATPPTTRSNSGKDVVLAPSGAVPHALPESNDAAPMIMAAEAALRAASPPAPQPALIRPINAKVTALVDSGKRAVLKGDLERASRDFSEAIRIDPKYPESYSERGQVLFRLGETERAIADYSAAIARDPQHGIAFRARGMAYLYLGKTDPALADLSKAIDLAEHDPRLLAPIELFYARRSRGTIYGSKQQYDLEIADYTSLIESYARDPVLVADLKANYGDAGAANILATVYRQRANVHIKRSDWDRAVADLTAAIPLSSDHGYTALIDRSRLYERLGRRDQSIADMQAALDVRPGSEEARLALNRLGASSKSTQPKAF